MNPLWQSSVVVFAILTWLAAPPQSLADASAREAFRRSTSPKTRIVLTNAGLPASAITSGAAITPPPGELPPDTAASVKPDAAMGAAAAKPGAAAASAKQDEQWWRKRISDARAKLAKDQQASVDLQGRINILQRDVVNRDSPTQQAKLREELQKALAALETNKTLIETDQKAIVAIQDDARRSDVPAGWVR